MHHNPFNMIMKSLTNEKFFLFRSNLVDRWLNLGLEVMSVLLLTRFVLNQNRDLWKFGSIKFMSKGSYTV